MGRGRVSPTSLISSCKCSSSEFCSLMKLNSAKFRSSTGGQWGKAGSGETRDAHAETNTGGRGQKARDGGRREIGKDGEEERGRGRADGKSPVERSLIAGSSSEGGRPIPPPPPRPGPKRWPSVTETEHSLHWIPGAWGREPAPLHPQVLTLQILFHQQVRVALPGHLGQFIQGVLVAQHQLLLGGLPEAFGHLPGWGARGQ